MTSVFESNRHFTTFDFLISHGQFLLRSQKSDEFDDNIDIIFFGTNYIQTFCDFKGISIRKIDKSENKISYPTVQNFLEDDNHSIFEISSNNEFYYVAASFVKVFKNRLAFNESSLGFSVDRGEEQVHG